jgi:hypothetical protein
MERIGDQLNITFKRTKRVEMVEITREKRSEQRPDLMFSARPFVLTGLPLKRPPNGTLLHERRNGNLFLQIVGHPQHGLPFGQDRIIPIWAITEALRTKSQTIQFRSAAQILYEFGLPRNGAHYKRLMQAFQRIGTSQIFFGSESQVRASKVWEMDTFRFFKKLRLWFSVDGSGEAPQDEECINLVQLSDEFWNELNQHGIPLNANIVRGLINTPGALDLAMFLNWRCFTVPQNDTARIPLFGSKGLNQQLGVVTYSRPRRFRQQLEEWLQLVKLFWPECPAVISNDGMTLILRHAQDLPSREAPRLFSL